MPYSLRRLSIVAPPVTMSTRAQGLTRYVELPEVVFLPSSHLCGHPLSFLYYVVSFPLPIGCFLLLNCTAIIRQRRRAPTRHSPSQLPWSSSDVQKSGRRAVATGIPACEALPMANVSANARFGYQGPCAGAFLIPCRVGTSIDVPSFIQLTTV